MIQTNSLDIQGLDYSVLLDITGSTPSLTLTNASTQANPANLKWAFEIYSPTGTPIHKGSIVAPDVNGNWNTPFVQSAGFPMPFGVPEVGAYKIIVTAQDLAGNTFPLIKNVNVCAPSGWSKDAKNFFGLAVHSILTRCQTSQIYAEDQTNYSYQGLAGTPVTRNFKLNFPMDETSVVPAPFSIDNFTSALIPITTSGEGYQSFQTSIYTYDFGNLITIKVKYIGRTSFAVHCNLDLGVLGCDIQKLIDQIENGDCDDVNDAQAKLNLINPKFALAIMGLQYPQSCIDPWKLVEEIKEIGGFTCNCCVSGISQSGALTGGGLSFLINRSGDIQASWNINGTNVTLTLQDVTYVFQLDPSYNGTAFTVNNSTNGTTKTYQLKVDESLLATELLNIIGANATLLNQLVTLTTQNSGKISINPKCLSSNLGFTGTNCDFTFSLSLAVGQKPLIDSFSFIDPNNPNGTFTVPVNFLFDQTNAVALQAALNTRLPNFGQPGAFVVAFDTGARKLTITISGTSLAFLGMSYINAGSPTPFDMTKSNCGGTASFMTPVIMQAMIDYMCNLAGHAIVSGCTFNINYLVKIAGDMQVVVASSDDSYCKLFTKLVDSFNQLTLLVQAVKEVNAGNILSLFQGIADVGVIEEHDYVYGQFNGNPGRVGPSVLATMVLQQFTGAMQSLFCNAVSSCNQPQCLPVSNATVVYDSVAQTLVLTITNSGALQYRIGYRSFKNTQFGPLTGPLVGIQVINATAGATTIYTWSNVPPNAWAAVVVAICQSGNAPPYTTAPSTNCSVPTTFTAMVNGPNFLVTWAGISGGATKVQLNIVYPNGGGTSIRYVTGATPLTLPIPAGIFGDFIFTLQSVCDDTNNWLSDPTNSITVNVPVTSTCPVPGAIQVQALTSTSVTVQMTKPTNSNVPVQYSLRYYDNNGGHGVLLNQGGNVVTWIITGLTPNTPYSFDIVSICADGSQSNPAAGGMFNTLPSIAANGSIRNASPATDVTQPLMVSVNNSLIYVKNNGLNHGVTDSTLVVPDTTGTIVKVRACGMIIATASIVSNGVTYGHSFIDSDGAAVFNNVNIVSGMAITFSN